MPGRITHQKIILYQINAHHQIKGQKLDHMDRHNSVNSKWNSPKRLMTNTSEYLHHIHALCDSAEVKKLFKITNICLIYCYNTYLIYCYDTQSDLLLQYTIWFTVPIHNLIYCYRTQFHLLLQYTISFTVTEHNLIYCYSTQFHLLLQYTILHLELIPWAINMESVTTGSHDAKDDLFYSVGQHSKLH